jgi:hypothetical protein
MWASTRRNIEALRLCSPLCDHWILDWSTVAPLARQPAEEIGWWFRSWAQELAVRVRRECGPGLNVTHCTLIENEQSCCVGSTGFIHLKRAIHRFPACLSDPWIVTSGALPSASRPGAPLRVAASGWPSRGDNGAQNWATHEGRQVNWVSGR